MRTWWQLLRQRGRLGAEFVRGRRGAGMYISDRALRLAAEVLEPRCLLTDATGLAAADGGGDILVDASQWDDAGLTLLRAGDLVHLVRTGTMQDVITPLPFDAAVRLAVHGRDDVSDILTIDISSFSQSVVRSGPFDVDGWNQMCEQGFPPNALRLQFDGGIGVAQDELRFIGKSEDYVVLDIVHYPAETQSSAAVAWWCDDPRQRQLQLEFSQFENVSLAVPGSYIGDVDEFAYCVFVGSQGYSEDVSNTDTDPIPNATQTLNVPPPANTLLGQGLDETRDEDATLPQTLVTDAESDGEDSGLNELDGQESNPADENDSTETAATTWDDSLTNPLLTDELLDGETDTMT